MSQARVAVLKVLTKQLTVAQAAADYGYSRRHLQRRVLAIADDTTITVTELETGEILSTHDIDPTKTYWRNTQRAPGRWPGAQ